MQIEEILFNVTMFKLTKRLNGMVYYHNILSILLFFSVLLATILLFILSKNYHVFAESPPVVRQEIQDGLDDVVILDDCNSTITKLTKLDNSQAYEMFDSMDIERVSYFSDGKALNATIWLKLPPGLDSNFLPPRNFPINFGILVDVNPNPAIGVGGVDYHKEVANYLIPDLPIINNTETTNLWIEDIHEAISSGPHRYVKVSEQNYNYTNVFEQQRESPGYVYYLPLSLDLNTIALPDEYKLMFYTISSNNSCTRVVDFTSWIDIPTPNFLISTSPNTLELRPDEEKNIGLVLKSTTGFVHKVVDFTNLENNSGIQVIAEGEKLNRSVFGVEPVPFNIKIPKNAKTGEYAIPMLANISTGSAIPSKFVGASKYNSSIPTESFITAVTNLTIKVLEPLTPSQIFKEVWNTYGGFISLVGGGFAAGVTSLVFDRFKDRKKKKSDDNTSTKS
jgi:hypothetical protein